MRRSYLPNPVFFVPGLLASLHIRNYRQRCEANWLARHGVPRDEIQRRLDHSYYARIVWGYWYVCIYFPFGLGALVTGTAFFLKGVSQAVGWQEPYCPPIGGWNCEPGPVLFPAFGALVGAGLVYGTWRAMSRINGIISAGIPGYGDRWWPRVPSWKVMAEGMPGRPSDEATRIGSGCLALAISVAFHGIALCSLVAGLVAALQRTAGN